MACQTQEAVDQDKAQVFIEHVATVMPVNPDVNQITYKHSVDRKMARKGSGYQSFIKIFEKSWSIEQELNASMDNRANWTP